MKKFLKRLLILCLGGFAATLFMYWFNLDNKLIYYVVRPMMNKFFDKKKRDVKL